MSKGWGWKLVLTLIVVMLISCNAVNQPVVDYLNAASALIDEWSDTFNRATSTSRVALSPVIGEMQRVRRDYEALEPPKPCAAMHENVVKAMDSTIDGFLAFMGEEDDAEITRLFERANSALDSALSDMRTLKAEYLE